jgi:hypothetical protein
MIGGFNFFEFFRSLSFGGLAGMGIAGIIYLNFPYLQTLTNLESFMMYGALIGGISHRAFAKVCEIILHPIGRFLTYYEQRIELQFLLKHGNLTAEKYKEITDKLTEQRFLGITLPTNVNPAKHELPPKE